MLCRVCKNNLVKRYGKCSYCGYENRAILNVELDDSMDFKNGVLSQVKDFSIMANQYKWNASKETFDSTPSEISLPEDKNNGKALMEGIVFTDPIIAQVGIGEEQELEICYSVNGKSKTVIAKITPKQSDDFWKLGMKIDENLKLHVYLGETESDSIPLELI